ncbi:hypothetical protein IID23_04635 [Patescibacteria group bacterium]|nr:hypothetical protein [Patescibacteria group bacterium]
MRNLDKIPLLNKLFTSTQLSVIIIIFLFISIPLTIIAIKKVEDFRSVASTCGPGCNWPDLKVSWTKRPYYLIEWCLNTTVRGSAFCEQKNQTSGTSTSIPVLDDWKVYWWVDTLVFDPHPTVRWKAHNSGSINKNCGGGFKSGSTCSHTVSWGAPTHTAKAFFRGTSRDACLGGPSSCRSTKTTTGGSVTFVDLPPNQSFDVSIFIKGYLFEKLTNIKTGSCSCVSAPIPTPFPPPSDPNSVIALTLTINKLSQLGGKMDLSISIKGVGYSRGVTITKNTKNIILKIPEGKVKKNKTYVLVIKGAKLLTKKVKFKSSDFKKTIKIGDLYLGDINSNNIVNQEDLSIYLNNLFSIDVDANFDEVVNSLDYSVILTNIGKKGN